MPWFHIRLINSEFESTDEGDYPSAEAAAVIAIKTAARVAVDLVSDGNFSEAIEVRVSNSERILTRHIVNLSVSPLEPNA